MSASQRVLEDEMVGYGPRSWWDGWSETPNSLQFDELKIE